MNTTKQDSINMNEVPKVVRGFFVDIVAHGYLEDRCEYGLEDWQQAYPNLSASDIEWLAVLVHRDDWEELIAQEFRHTQDVVWSMNPNKIRAALTSGHVEALQDVFEGEQLAGFVRVLQWIIQYPDHK